MAVLGPGAGQVLLGLVFYLHCKGFVWVTVESRGWQSPAPRTHAGRARTVAMVSVIGASPCSCGPVGGRPQGGSGNFPGPRSHQCRQGVRLSEGDICIVLIL